MKNISMTKITFSTLLGIVFCFLIQPKCFSESAFNKDFPILSNSYKFEKEPVDYIIVIDRSGTVRTYWDEIKSAIFKVINLSKDGDYITIIGFHSSSDYLVLPRTINSRVKQELISEVNRLTIPNGSFTDLFDSVDKTLESINRPNGNSLQAIFYFTDFKNDPPNETRWKPQNIHLLETKYSNYVVKTNKLVNVFAFQLPLDTQAGRDYGLFNNIFDQTVFKILVNAGSMDEWFVRLEDQLKSQRLNLRVKTDLKEFITLKSVSTNRERIKLTIENMLPFDTYLNKVTIGSGSVSEIIKESYSNLTIKAKGQTDIFISAKTFLQKHPAFLEHTIRIEKPELSLSFSFEDLNTEFAKLNIGPLATQQLAYKDDLSFRIGIPYWVFIVAGLVFIFISFLFYKTWIKPEWIFKKKGFRVTISLDGKLLNSYPQFFNTNKIPVEITQAIIKQTDISTEDMKILSSIQFNLFVVPVKPKLFRNRPTRGTYIYVDSKGTFTLKKLVRGKITQVALSKNKRLLQHPVHLHKGISITGIFNTGMNQSKIEINFLNK